MSRYDPPKRYVQPTKQTAAQRAYRLRKLYKISVEDWQALLDKQNGHCAICLNTDRLAVDHDHACCPGKESCGACVRAILCGRCNTLLGLAEESEEYLRQVLTYVKDMG